MEIEDQDETLPHIPNQREGRGDVKYSAAGGRKETKDKARKEFKSERRAELEKERQGSICEGMVKESAKVNGGKCNNTVIEASRDKGQKRERDVKMKDRIPTRRGKKRDHSKEKAKWKKRQRLAKKCRRYTRNRQEKPKYMMGTTDDERKLKRRPNRMREVVNEIETKRNILVVELNGERHDKGQELRVYEIWHVKKKGRGSEEGEEGANRKRVEGEHQGGKERGCAAGNHKDGIKRGEEGQGDREGGREMKRGGRESEKHKDGEKGEKGRANQRSEPRGRDKGGGGKLQKVLQLNTKIHVHFATVTAIDTAPADRHHMCI